MVFPLTTRVSASHCMLAPLRLDTILVGGE